MHRAVTATEAPMPSPHTTPIAALALVLLCTAGCGGEETDTEAPSISDLTYSPQTVPVGEATVVSGTFSFEDPDGDVLGALIAMTPPGGETQELPRADIPRAAGVTAADVMLQVLVNAQIAGRYEFEVWVEDEAGNESNRLEGAVVAE
jgi:hypothetical protein